MKPDIAIANKMKKAVIIVDVAIPGEKKIIDKEKKGIQQYWKLKREIQRLWNIKEIDVIPVVLRTPGSVTEKFEKYVDQIKIKIKLHTAQKTHYQGLQEYWERY